ncbi:hypothetical protein FGW37_04615 [Streptomyces rectiverticillatus]|uniref:hypothetical protein n=1 Tax=Streptomyces rectiverticillatus TaxID=173860 RepID=UPI0015C322C8|nr:hypothetical protein [Streptomyces rectiverticillatus]QLE70985.1 hypothetical protein FGW37_04615 [Streptomyces rectiverticillatus]
MHRLPAVTVMAAVALAAAGCVSVSQPPASHSPPRPPGHSRPGDLLPGPAREDLITTGPDGARSPTAPGQDPRAATAGGASGPEGAITPSGRSGAHGHRDGADPADPYDFGDPPDPSDDGAEPSRSSGSPRLSHPPRSTGRSWASPDRRASPDLSPSYPRSEAPAPQPEQRTADSPPASASHREASSAAPPPQAPPPAPAPRARNNNVCAMGRQHGRWQQGGDASRICDSVYGH